MVEKGGGVVSSCLVTPGQKGLGVPWASGRVRICLPPLTGSLPVCLSRGQCFTASTVYGKASSTGVGFSPLPCKDWGELVGDSCSCLFRAESRRVKLQGILADLRDVDGLPPKVTVPPPGTPQPRPHEGNLQPHTLVTWGL